MDGGPSIAEMRRAVGRRDASYDGVFFVAVRTTGIFCRPSCRTKPARAENLEFFKSADQAIRSGYRPCKRCQPLGSNGLLPPWVQRLLSAAQTATDGRLRDCDLRAMSIDPAKARRYFKRQFGMTFQAFDRARRMGMALTRIRRGTSLSAVAFGHGYESTSGFRDAFGKTFGKTPGRSRAADCIVSSTVDSPIGPLLVCATTKGVCLLEFQDGRSTKALLARLGRRLEIAVVPGGNEHLAQLKDELRRYFAGELRKFTVPLVYPGTPFQEAVWKRLLKIPYGETKSYEQIAREIGRPMAQRAVGMANHSNPIGIVIPCHRVVNKNGELGGYGGGLWRKRFLLDLEREAAGR